MKLALVPHYERGPNGLTWWLKRMDVTDVNSFFRAERLTAEPVAFPREDRQPEHMVRVEFYKAPGYMGYVMPVTDFRRLLKTNLEPF